MSIITVEIEDDILAQAIEICAKNGLTLDEAAELFLKKCIELKGLPFPMDEEK